MREHTKYRLLVASSFVWATSFALAGTPARTPDELIQRLVSAANQGDADTFLNHLTESSRTAVKQAFGQPSAVLTTPMNTPERTSNRTTADNLKSTLSQLKKVEILNMAERPDGTAELRVRSSIQSGDGKILSQEDTLLAHQEDGAWKLAGWRPTVRVYPLSQPGTPVGDLPGQEITVKSQHEKAPH
jgi:hypothetical protein